MRKVFISFLGINKYKFCNYYFNHDQTDIITNVRFVQEALLKRYCTSWGEEDCALIFLTKKAEQENWIEKANSQGDKQTEHLHGLKYHLSRLNLALSLKPIKETPKGHIESEIWKIFDLVIEQVQDQDEIYLDITHGFRSLPMLGMVLVNYLKVTKNIQVGGIFYGAFETLGPGFKIKDIPREKRNAPVVDLGPLHNLQNWVIGADNFINYAVTGKIDQAVSEEIGPIMRLTKGKDPKASALKIFQNKLKDLSPGFQTVRGKEILEGKKIQELKKQIETIKHLEMVAPLKNILDKISGKLLDFEEKNIGNGFAGVKWCIDHGMIQQGITLLQENTITWVLTTLELDYTKQLYRDITSQAFRILGENIPRGEWHNPSKSNPESAEKIQTFINNTGLLSNFNSLTEYRNDINHGGYSVVKNETGRIIKQPRAASKFSKILDKQYSEIRNKICAFKTGTPLIPETKSGHKKMLLLFNHTLVPEQETEARELLGVEEFVSPPKAVRDIWAQVPPEFDALAEYLTPVISWMEQEAKLDDFVLVQGDFGATHLLITYAYEQGLVPVYATTIRKAGEITMPDGSVRMEHVFRFCRFRRYGR